MLAKKLQCYSITKGYIPKHGVLVLVVIQDATPSVSSKPAVLAMLAVVCLELPFSSMLSNFSIICTLICVILIVIIWGVGG
jgi:hypothetical protein